MRTGRPLGYEPVLVLGYRNRRRVGIGAVARTDRVDSGRGRGCNPTYRPEDFIQVRLADRSTGRNLILQSLNLGGHLRRFGADRRENGVLYLGHLRDDGGFYFGNTGHDWFYFLSKLVELEKNPAQRRIEIVAEMDINVVANRDVHKRMISVLNGNFLFKHEDAIGNTPDLHGDSIGRPLGVIDGSLKVLERLSVLVMPEPDVLLDPFELRIQELRRAGELLLNQRPVTGHPFFETDDHGFHSEESGDCPDNHSAGGQDVSEIDTRVE